MTTEELKDELDEILDFLSVSFLTNTEFEKILEKIDINNITEKDKYKGLYMILNERCGDSTNIKDRLQSYFYAKYGEEFNTNINNNNIPIGVVL